MHNATTTAESSRPQRAPTPHPYPHPHPHPRSHPHIAEPVAQRYEEPDYEESMASWEAPQFEKVYWMKEPHLRKLYAWACVLMIASATTGFDA